MFRQSGERPSTAILHGLYVEAPKNEKELEQIGKAFHGVPQMTNMFEGDDESPWLTPGELNRLGFSMILYPTTLLFRVVRTLSSVPNKMVTTPVRAHFNF